MTKIYAKQVPPEYQESPLYMWEEWPENVFVFGNRRYNQHAERLDEIRRGLEEIADEWEELHNGGSRYYSNWIDALNDILPPDDTRGEYTRAERLELARLAAQYERAGSKENDVLCAVLHIVTGQEYAAGTICGCCQGDWQEIIYPAEYGREWLETFEAEYFNTGSEWCIKENEGDPGYYQYCTGWNNDLIRAEIANAAGTVPENVILYGFTGWSRSAEYMEAQQ